ncbi:LAQU0S18e00452g1_1 [Lachancea quebecensis]|uniref:LAQU0S18e00452g1_1 n=1 Tax=Lachancea quebecensis TaxID=1654605 RepID=A0A0P1KYU2_9SACH|nr:LAQU0S18e00452g1_1 [Lachancea quebecensis]
MLDHFPTELQLRLLACNPQLAFVSRGWYRLNNLFYRDLCVQLRPESYWKCLATWICEYVRSLDPDRREARLINKGFMRDTAGEFVEFMCDSWQILYSVLFASPRFFGMESARREIEDSINSVSEYCCPMELVGGREYECSVWFRKRSTVNKFGAVRVVCEADAPREAGAAGLVGSDAVLLARDLPVSIDNWCESAGMYSFAAGRIRVPPELGHVQDARMRVWITGPTSVEMVAVDLRPYQRDKQWLFLSTTQQEIFSVEEQRLSKARMGWATEHGEGEKAPAAGAPAEDFRVVYRFPREQGKALKVSSVRYPWLGQGAVTRARDHVRNIT